MYDLSIVTDALRQIIIDALAASPLFGGGPPTFSFAVSGQHPQQPPSGADCDLNLYLFHLTENKFLKNYFWSQASITGQPPGPPLQPIAYEPLCLDLFYLLTAQSQASYVNEQQVMSVAMRALHEYGTVKLATPTPTGEAISEVSLGLESPTWDELARLWQALTVPLRATAQYRAGVAMLLPEPGPLTSPIHPTQWTIVSQPATWDPDDTSDPPVPVLYGTSRRVTYLAPVTGPREFDQVPASAAPAPAPAGGQAFMLRGYNLVDADPVYLIEYGPGGAETETDITATWKQPLAPPYTTQPVGGVPFMLRPPPTPPGSCPPPGQYGLRIGQPGDPAWRSATVPFSIAPWIDPAGGPLLNPSGGTYSFTSTNIPATGAELRLGTVPLTQITSGAPAAGQWVLGGATVTFAAPAGLPTANYAIRIRAGNVEADPALWAVVS